MRMELLRSLPGSSSKLNYYLLIRDRIRRSIATPKRYSNFLIASRIEHVDLIAYALYVASDIDDSKPKLLMML